MLGFHRFSSSEHAGYRFGFQGQEKDDEITGTRSHYTAKFWEYDSRIGRRWNVDPITYPWHGSYTAFNNNPVIYTDPLGLFGSRKEAREYKREQGLKGRIQKGKDGVFAINDSKGGQSYYKDPSMDGVQNVPGRGSDGVFTAPLATDKHPGSLSVLKTSLLYYLPNVVSNSSGIGGDGKNNGADRHRSMWPDWNVDTKWLEDFLGVQPNNNDPSPSRPSRQVHDPNSRTFPNQPGGGVSTAPEYIDVPTPSQQFQVPTTGDGNNKPALNQANDTTLKIVIKKDMAGFYTGTWVFILKDTVVDKADAEKVNTYRDESKY